MTNVASLCVPFEQETWSSASEELLDLFDRWAQLEDSEKLGVLLRKYLHEEDQSKVELVLRRFLSPKPETTVEWPADYQFSEKVTDACREFADSHELNVALESCLSKARVLFSNITSLHAELDQFRDREPEDPGHIVIRVEVASNEETVLRDYDAWADWIVVYLTPQEGKRFTLTVGRV